MPANYEEELTKRLQTIKSNPTQQEHSVWANLQARLKDVTEDELAEIMKDKNVQQTEQAMLSAFINTYLFGKLRNEFAGISSYTPLCENYANAILNIKSKKTEDLKTENADLKKRIEELEKTMKGEINAR